LITLSGDTTLSSAIWRVFFEVLLDCIPLF
jgi:hypothetical protein